MVNVEYVLAFAYDSNKGGLEKHKRRQQDGQVSHLVFLGTESKELLPGIFFD
jgi:hypothetical protein